VVRKASRSAISAGETTLSRSDGIDDCGSMVIVLMSPRVIRIGCPACRRVTVVGVCSASVPASERPLVRSMM